MDPPKVYFLLTIGEYSIAMLVYQSAREYVSRFVSPENQADHDQTNSHNRKCC